MNIMKYIDTKTIQTTLCRIYIKPILTYNAETWTLTMRKTRKVQAMGMNILRSMQGQQEGIA
jgi:hypothetical protein